MSSSIYHLALDSDWQAAQKKDIYQAESLELEGYIHCSLWEQTRPVFERYYTTTPGLWLLHIDSSLLGASELVYENTSGGTELFPHVYGAIELKAIIAVHPLVSGAGEMSWPEQNFA